MSLGPAKGRVESSLLAFLRTIAPKEEEVLIIAYSGGPDSTALLAAAAALNRVRLLAVHVDHGLRPEPERLLERKLVIERCGELGVRLTIARIRPGAVEERAERKHCGVEAAARDYRYHALETVMKREASSHVLFAHNYDDQVETVLMRLFGGSGSEGLRGIEAVNPPWFRPLLGLSKRELLEYLTSRGIAWSEDSTNVSLDFLRNRVRRLLVPLLDGEFVGWRKGLGLTIERASMEAAAIREGAEAIAFGPAGDGCLAVDATSFLSRPESFRLYSLLTAAGKLTGRNRLSYRMARAALSALGEGGRYRGSGIALSARDGRLLLRRGLDFPSRGGYFVVIAQPCRVKAGRLVVEASWTLDKAYGIRADAFRFPLVVRSRRPGDSIAMNGGEKHLDGLFSEWGLTAELRGSVPVVEDRDGIVAVLGSPFGVKDRYRELPKAEGGELTRLSVTVKGA
ncbi:MAG: tRNA lysidine(34) synthetase TilS [Rectinemataceae bacterium]